MLVRVSLHDPISGDEVRFLGLFEPEYCADFLAAWRDYCDRTPTETRVAVAEKAANLPSV